MDKIQRHKRQVARFILKERRSKLKEIEANPMFGVVYKGFFGKPKEAIEYLKLKKCGEITDALYRKDIGFVSLIWGCKGSPEKNYQDGFGLAHIYHKHEKELLQIGYDVPSCISEIFTSGLLTSFAKEHKIKLSNSDFQLVIKTKWNDIERRFVLTAYDLRPLKTKATALKRGQSPMIRKSF